MLCKCQQETRDREEQEQHQREFRDRVHFLRREAFRNIPGKDWRFDNAQNSDRLDKVKRLIFSHKEMI